MQAHNHDASVSAPSAKQPRQPASCYDDCCCPHWDQRRRQKQAAFWLLGSSFICCCPQVAVCYKHIAVAGRDLVLDRMVSHCLPLFGRSLYCRRQCRQKPLLSRQRRNLRSTQMACQLSVGGFSDVCKQRGVRNLHPQLPEHAPGVGRQHCGMGTEYVSAPGRSFRRKPCRRPQAGVEPPALAGSRPGHSVQVLPVNQATRLAGNHLCRFDGRVGHRPRQSNNIHICCSDSGGYSYIQLYVCVGVLLADGRLAKPLLKWTPCLVQIIVQDIISRQLQTFGSSRSACQHSLRLV